MTKYFFTILFSNINSLQLYCPSTITLPVGSDCFINVPDIKNIIALDNDNNTMNYIQSPEPELSLFTVGDYPIKFKVSSLEEEKECTTMVTLEDQTAPIYTMRIDPSYLLSEVIEINNVRLYFKVNENCCGYTCGINYVIVSRTNRRRMIGGSCQNHNQCINDEWCVNKICQDNPYYDDNNPCQCNGESNEWWWCHYNQGNGDLSPGFPNTLPSSSIDSHFSHLYDTCATCLQEPNNGLYYEENEISCLASTTPTPTPTLEPSNSPTSFPTLTCDIEDNELYNIIDTRTIEFRSCPDIIYTLHGSCYDDSNNYNYFEKTLIVYEELPTEADPNCDNGISKGAVCCLSICGTCGGSGCSLRPGGAEGCCGGRIVSNNLTCSYNPAPCIL